jgi:hypothetical protein
LKRLWGTRTHRNVTALRGKSMGGCQANSLAGGSDQRNFRAQSKFHKSGIINGVHRKNAYCEFLLRLRHAER